MEDTRIQANLSNELRTSIIQNGDIREFMSDVADYIEALRQELTDAYNKINELEDEIYDKQSEIGDLEQRISELEED